MNSQAASDLEVLRSALLELDATGPNGFEGLLAAALSSICGQPFRLASSGSQRGRDGDSAFDDGATYFECKRYDGKVPREQILVKLLYLKSDNAGQVDTYILAATSAIAALDADDFRTAAAGEGIGLLLLDWSDTSFPPLVTALGIAKQTTVDFLHAHLTTAQNVSALDAERAIDSVTRLPGFFATSVKLKEELSRPSVGLGLAKSANWTWHETTFSSRIVARQYFGQPLAPRDPTGLQAWPRAKLRASIRPAFSGPPQPSVFIVMGDEGAGKSWLVADAWLAATPAPLLAVATANALENPADLVGLEDLLIKLLLQQTGGEHSEANKRRWRRRLACWRANPTPANVRVTLWVDGLDQAPDFPWTRWIDPMSAFLERIGGRLVVTTRSVHYARIRHAIVSAVKPVVVIDWAPDELTAILKSRGIDGNILNPAVFNTLRNPRILGIAVELLDGSAIESMQELSVGRLLFEHLRSSEREGTSPLSGTEFAKTLQDLGRGIFEKLEANELDDLKLVDARLDKRVQAVSSSRFFAPVADDPDLYEIREDGLQLALGLSLVSTLEKEFRNGRAPSERLAQILGPIAALDLTAEVVGSAVELACLRDTCPVEVTSAIVRHYVGLQNLPEARSEAFAALTRRAPKAFVSALEDVGLAPEHVSNSAWLLYALLQNRDHPEVWKAISERIPVWLATFSLSPDRRLFRNATDSKEKMAEERAKLLLDIQSRFDALTVTERAYVDKNLTRRDDVEPDSLNRSAFFLLAGRPLAEFAPALVNWAISNSLNSSISSPRVEFHHLIQFNSVDWPETRDALLACLRLLGTVVTSSIGDWTAVSVLRATGTLDDAERAQTLVEHLTKDRERFESWRLMENYCRSDPCDPGSLRPDNIESTARRYEELDEAKLRQDVGMPVEDHFFRDAMTGLARFEPLAAVAVIRRLSKDALTRSTLARRQAVLTLLSHSVLLDEATATEFVTAGQATSGDSGAENQDNWITAQYSLFLALPHLSASSQLAAVADMRGTSMLLNMMRSLLPADEQTIEDWLVRAEQTGDEELQVRVLGAVGFSSAPLSPRSIAVVGELMFAEDKKVRTQALGVAATTADLVFLRRMAESDWSAESLNSETDIFEIWYGSKILVAAAEAGILSLPDAMNRISLTHYGMAAARLGNSAANMIADRINVAIANVANVVEVPALPEIERETLRSDDREPQLVRLNERYSPKDLKATFEAFSESRDEFDARQERARNEYRRFNKNLTEADAQLVLADLGVEGISAVIAARPNVIQPWCDMILSARPEKRRPLHLFTIAFVGALARSHPTKAITLLRAVREIEPLVTQIVGRSKLRFEAVTVWMNADVPEFKTECIMRLDDALNDSELAQEVLTAFWVRRDDVIKEYVESRLSSAEPARIARALMVTGFSDRSDAAAAVLARYQGTVGFIGHAAAAAQYTYERNMWSRHWYEQMNSTSDPIEFWRYSVLLRKIVDGRVMLWGLSNERLSDMCKRFLPTLDSEIDSRVNKWREQRRGKLFGEKAPESLFLQANQERDLRARVASA